MTNTSAEWFAVCWWWNGRVAPAGFRGYNTTTVHVTELPLFIENRDLNVERRDANEFFPGDRHHLDPVPEELQGQAAVAPIDTGEFLAWDDVQTIISGTNAACNTDERRRKIIRGAIEATRNMSDRADEVTTESSRDGDHITYRVNRKDTHYE